MPLAVGRSKGISVHRGTARGHTRPEVQLWNGIRRIQHSPDVVTVSQVGQTHVGDHDHEVAYGMSADNVTGHRRHWGTIDLHHITATSHGVAARQQ